MKIILVRHGERTYDKEDDELTNNGKEQVKHLANRLKYENIKCIYTNNLTRSKQTASILAEILGTTIIYSPILNELDIDIFFEDNIDIENTLKDLNVKLDNFIEDIRMRNDNIILAANAGINRAIIGKLLDIPIKKTITFNQNYAAVTELEYVNKYGINFWRLNLLNCKRHLPATIMS